MAIFRPLATRSPQRLPGRASRNKVLADSVNDPDNAEKPDDLDESDNSYDSDGSPMTSWAYYPSCKKCAWFRFPQPGQWPKSRPFLLTAYCKMATFRAQAVRSLQKLSDRASKNKVLADSANDPDNADKPDDF